MGSLLDSIYKPIVVHAMSFLPRSTLKLQSKCQIWGTLSSWEMGCWATKCDIHCYWIGSYPTLDVWGRLEELLAAFTNPSLFIAFIQVDSQIAHKMTDFGYPPCKRTGTGCCTERYQLLLECCIPFLGCICKMRGGFDSIYTPFIVHTVSFLLKSIFKLCTKY